MPYWMLDTLVTAPQAVVLAAAALFALRPRRPWLFALSFCLSQPLLYLLLRHLLPVPHWLASLLLTASTFAVPLLFCREKRALCAVFSLLTFSVMLFSEFLTGLIAYAVLPAEFHYSPQAVAEHPVAFKLLYLVITLLLVSAFLWLWGRANGGSPRYDQSQRLLLVPFFFSQAGFLLVLMYLLITDQLLRKGAAPLALMAGLLFILSNVALYLSVTALLRRQRERQRQESLLWAMEDQFTVFQQLVRQEENRSKLRHDLNNQLQTAYALFAGGQTEQAAQHIRRLTELTLRETPPFFCVEPTINALLWQKSSLCREAGIHLDAVVDLPPDFSMDPLVLCSLFGNLLDNAIHACQAPPPEDQGHIWLRVRQEAGFLLVRCENTVHSAPKQPEDRRHWGLRILEDIAAMYGGSVEILQEANHFQVQMGLQINRELRCDDGNHHHL